MVLLWGAPRDAPMAGVRAALCERGAETVFIDERDALATSLELEIGHSISGRIRRDGRWIDLDAATAGYVRPYGAHCVLGVATGGPGSDAWNHAHALEQYMWMWAEHTRARVVNRPSAMASNDSKPYQAAIIRRCGLPVPDTLITTDSALARDFIERHGSVVYKSISSVRSVVSRLGPEQMTRLDDVRWCPTQFQEYVSGPDYRVHVVGDELFGVEIESDADDYRYAHAAQKRCQIRTAQIHEDIADSCRRVTRELGLLFSGIDLRRTPDGEWYCFEVNPSPGFTFFDTESGDIAHAVARLLTEAA